MGTFIGFNGDMTIPKEKFPEFTGMVIRIFEQGGMMGTERVEIFEKRITLLKPLSPNEDGQVICSYNYFEDDAWENAVYNAKTGTFSSHDIGYLQFSEVICAVYTLYELYTKGAGAAYRDEAPLEKEPYIGWLNYLFDENFGGNGEKITTTDFLGYQGFSDDDRICAWTPKGDVHFSVSMELWLKELQAELTAIKAAIAPSSGVDILKTLTETLDEAKEFGHMYAFREMFYDFIHASLDARRYAAVVLLQRMVRDGKNKLPPNGNHSWLDWQKKRFCLERQRVKRYLAVLGNLELRRNYFAF